MLLEGHGEYDKAFVPYSVYLTNIRKATLRCGGRGAVQNRQTLPRAKSGRSSALPFAPSMTRAQEMFEGILKRAPFSKFAPLAQSISGSAWKTGEVSRSDRGLSGGGDEFIRTMRSPDDAQYQICYCCSVKRGKVPTMPLRNKRRASLLRISSPATRERESPAGARTTINQSRAGRPGSTRHRKILREDEKYKAAVLYYNEVSQESADSPESAVAKARIVTSNSNSAKTRGRPDRRKRKPARGPGAPQMQARVDTVSRPDYVGPTVVVPEVETGPSKPKLRTSPMDCPVTGAWAHEPPCPEEITAQPGHWTPQPPQETPPSSSRSPPSFFTGARVIKWVRSQPRRCARVKTSPCRPSRTIPSNHASKCSSRTR